MNQYIQMINFVGILILSLAFIYYNWRQGQGQVTKEILDLYEKQIKALKDEIDTVRQRNHELANQMTSMNLKIGNLEGSLKEKDVKLQEYMTILQNRNPDLEKVLKEIRDFMRMIHDQLPIKKGK